MQNGNKTSGSNSLVGELLKCMVVQIWFTFIWSSVQEEGVPEEWREGLVVNLFKKGNRKEPGNYSITECCR